MPGFPVPLRAFAESLGVKTVTTQVPTMGGQRTVFQWSSGGHEDEVWLKLLQIRHPNERHSLEGWSKLIDQYRNEPAHPSDPRYNPPVL